MSYASRLFKKSWYAFVIQQKCSTFSTVQDLRMKKILSFLPLFFHSFIAVASYYGEGETTKLALFNQTELQLKFNLEAEVYPSTRDERIKIAGTLSPQKIQYMSLANHRHNGTIQLGNPRELITLCVWFGKGPSLDIPKGTPGDWLRKVVQCTLPIDDCCNGIALIIRMNSAWEEEPLAINGDYIDNLGLGAQNLPKTDESDSDDLPDF